MTRSLLIQSRKMASQNKRDFCLKVPGVIGIIADSKWNHCKHFLRQQLHRPSRSAPLRAQNARERPNRQFGRRLKAQNLQNLLATLLE